MRKQKSPKKPNRFQQIPIGFNQAPLGMLPGSDLPPLPTQSLQGGGWPWPPPTGNPSQWGPWMQGQVDAGTTTGQTYQTLLNSGSPFQGDWLSTVGNFNQGLQNIYSDTATGSHGRKYSAYKTAEDYAHDSLNDNVRRDGYQQAAEYSKLMDEYNTFQTGKKNIGQVSDIMGPTAALFQGMKGEQAYNQKYKPNMTALPGFFGFGRGGLVPGYIKGQIFDTDIPAIPVIRGAKQKNAISANSRRIPSFRKQFGGNGIVNTSGFSKGTETNNRPFNIIPGSHITSGPMDEYTNLNVTPIYPNGIGQPFLYRKGMQDVIDRNAVGFLETKLPIRKLGGKIKRI